MFHTSRLSMKKSNLIKTFVPTSVVSASPLACAQRNACLPETYTYRVADYAVVFRGGITHANSYPRSVTCCTEKKVFLMYT